MNRVSVSVLSLAAWLTACGIDPLAAKPQLLETTPIETLPTYKGGQILHPWHFAKPNAQRFPQRSVGLASDPQCFLADSYFRSCLIYECDADYSCTTGTCVDAALAFDPDGSTESATPSGAAVFLAPDGTVYPVLHLAVCLKT